MRAPLLASRIALGVGAVSLLAVVAGHGAGPSLTTAALVAARSAAPSWAPAQPGEKVYPGIGLRTLPAPSHLTPGIDSAAALRSPAVVDSGLAAGVPDTDLRLVTTGAFPASDDSPEVTAVKRLAWVFTYHDSSPAIRGAIGFTPPADPPTTCDAIVVVDAATAAHILVAQICPGT